MKGLSRETLLQIANGDVEGLLKAEQSYGKKEEEWGLL